jgi:glycerophosphoryl diester phosphodiesterase
VRLLIAASLVLLAAGVSATAGDSPPVLVGGEVVQRHPDRPWVVAHRGASADAPENTLAAYRLAIERGARIAETDVHLAADGTVIAIHDDTVGRTTDGEGAVASMTRAALKKLDAGSWKGPAFAGEPLPTLGELLDLTKDRLVLCIEIKAGQGIVPKVAELLDARAMRDQVIVFSFDADAVREARALLPDVPAVFLARNPDKSKPYSDAAVDQALAVDASALGMSHRYVERPVVDAAHAAGLPVFVWTVNEPEAMRAMAGLGVDVVISDVPALAAGVLSGK